MTVLDLVGEIVRLMGVEAVPQVLGEARHEIRHQYLCAAKARRHAGLAAAVQSGRGAATDDRLVQATILEQGTCTMHALSADLVAKSA